MKYFTKRTRLTSCFTAACALVLATPSYAIKLWQDDDPPSGTANVNANISITTVSGVSGVTDANHPTVGAVDLTAATSGFYNINNGAMPISFAEHGQPFTLSVDYFIPADSNLTSSDTIYFSIGFDSDATGTNGLRYTSFIPDPTTINPGWNTLTLTGTVPATNDYTVGGGTPGPGDAVDEVNALLIFRDGIGGTGDPEDDDGVAVYIDNICLDVQSAAVSQKVWRDDDPASGQTIVGGGIIVTNVNSGPAINGDHPTAGEVDLGSVSGGFTNINGGAIPITADEHGLPFTFTVDYFVPDGTSLSDTDTMYLSLGFDSNANGTNGLRYSNGFFVPSTVANTGWNTLTITGTVPATNDYAVGGGTPGPGDPVDELNAQIVFRDGAGGGGDAEDDTGVALYIDNICLEVSTTNPTFLVKAWQDDDPASGQTVVGGGIFVTNVNSGPAIDGDHPTAGEVDLGAVTGGFVNINGGDIGISSFNYGKPFTFTVDYFVPDGTSMSATDTMYLSLGFDSDAAGTNGLRYTAGFFDPTAVAPGWNSLTITGTVPATNDYAVGTGTPGPGDAVDKVSALILFRDGAGGGGDPEPDTGVALYLDDICLEIGSSVLPTEYRKLWQDDDPLGSESQENGGLSVTNVNTGPAIDGDHPTAGLIDHSSANTFSSIGGVNAPFSIIQGDYGQPYSFTIDYYVPSDTVMDDGTGGDLFYVQMNFNSASGGSTGANLAAGFINAGNAVLDAWNTITLSGTVPATDDYTGSTASGPGNPVDELTATFIYVDGGFGGTPDQEAGVSVYVDNICLEIGTEPVDPGPTPTVVPIEINSIVRSGTNVTLNYDTIFNTPNFEGVDIYRSVDLVNWTAVGFVTNVGSNLEVTFTETDDDQFYILVEPGEMPSFGSFDDSGINDITP